MHGLLWLAIVVGLAACTSRVTHMTVGFARLPTLLARGST